MGKLSNLRTESGCCLLSENRIEVSLLGKDALGGANDLFRRALPRKIAVSSGLYDTYRTLILRVAAPDEDGDIGLFPSYLPEHLRPD